MYDVEAKIMFIQPSITYPVEEMIGFEWEDIYNVPQGETDQAELQEARLVATEARKCYTDVRIVKILPGGERAIVSE